MGTLPFSREKFFAELEPKLKSIALKYRIQDAAGEARSWYARFTEIFDSINSNPDHVVLQNLDTGKPEQAREQIKQHLVGYLIQGFKNSLIRRDAYDLHTSKIDMPDVPSRTTVGQADHQTIVNDAIDQARYELDDLLAILDGDLAKLQDASGERKIVLRIFIQAARTHYGEIRAELGNFPIVKNLSAAKPRDFFVREIFDGRIAGIQKQLGILHASETRELIRQALFRLLDPKDDGQAFRQKLIRYFSGMHGGLHKRLLRRRK